MFGILLAFHLVDKIPLLIGDCFRPVQCSVAPQRHSRSCPQTCGTSSSARGRRKTCILQRRGLGMGDKIYALTNIRQLKEASTIKHICIQDITEKILPRVYWYFRTILYTRGHSITNPRGARQLNLWSPWKNFCS